MLVTRWSLKLKGEEQEDEAIPMWVHLEKVPLHMYSWEGFSFITSPVGVPVKLHQETIACTNLEEAKVYVRVDTSKVLPREITFTKGGEQFTVKYYYPWLPARCKLCDKWGHGEAVWVMNSKRKKHRSSLENKARQGSPVKSVEKEKGEEEKEVEGSNLVKEDKVIEVGEKSNGKEENDWLTPVKGSKGQVFPVLDSKDTVISTSKFSILLDEREEGELLMDDQDNIDEDVGGKS